jgi:hypothetical protein
MDWSSYDYFIIAISSHAKNHKFQTSDSRATDFYYLQQQFDGVNCPGLLGMPKIILINVCR